MSSCSTRPAPSPEGRPQVTEVVPLAAMPERAADARRRRRADSDHPLSRAIVDAAVESGYDLPPADRLRVDHGPRRRGDGRGQHVVAGNRAPDRRAGIAIDADDARSSSSAPRRWARTVIFVAVDGRVEGVIGIADEVKKNAPRARSIAAALGLRVIMMTGDNERAAAARRRAAGIDEYRAAARPEDKLALVRRSRPRAWPSPWSATV